MQKARREGRKWKKESDQVIEERKKERGRVLEEERKVERGLKGEMMEGCDKES